MRISKFWFVLLFCVLCCGLVLALAKGVPTDTIHLGYDNGIYSEVPSGAYTSLYRIDGVWYVNGVIVDTTIGIEYGEWVLSSAFCMFFIGLEVFLIYKGKAWLVNLLVGMLGLAIGAWIVNKEFLSFAPYMSFGLLVMSVLCMLSAGLSFKRKR